MTFKSILAAAKRKALAAATYLQARVIEPSTAAGAAAMVAAGIPALALHGPSRDVAVVLAVLGGARAMLAAEGKTQDVAEIDEVEGAIKPPSPPVTAAAR